KSHQHIASPQTDRSWIDSMKTGSRALSAILSMPTVASPSGRERKEVRGCSRVKRGSQKALRQIDPRQKQEGEEEDQREGAKSIVDRTRGLESAGAERSLSAGFESNLRPELLRGSGRAAQLLEERLGVLQIGGVEALGEPVVDFGEHRAGL